VGTPDFGGSCALTFFEPHRSEIRWAGSFVPKPDANPRRQAVREPTHQNLDTTETRSTPGGYSIRQFCCIAVLAGNAEKTPGSRYAFEFVFAAVVEVDLGSGEEISDRARHEHFARSGERRHPLTDVDGDARHVVSS
jgi:hypothetical protein